MLKKKMKKWRHRNPDHEITQEWLTVQKQRMGPAKKRAKELLEKRWAQAQDEITLCMSKEDTAIEGFSSCTFLEFMERFSIEAEDPMLEEKVSKLMAMGGMKRKKLTKARCKELTNMGLPSPAMYMYYLPFSRNETKKSGKEMRTLQVEPTKNHDGCKTFLGLNMEDVEGKQEPTGP